MKHITITSILFTTLLTMSACSSKHIGVYPDEYRYKINKTKNIKYIADTYNKYLLYKSNKAIAIAIDRVGRAALGYSFDCNTIEGAKRIALENCEKSRHKSKATSECSLFAVDDKVLHIDK